MAKKHTFSLSRSTATTLILSMVVGAFAYHILKTRAEATCGSQPNWPDCAGFSCSNGNWTCTSMKSPAGGSYTPPNDGNYYNMPNGGWNGGGDPKAMCQSGCNNMTCSATLPAEQLAQCTRQKASCIDGCNNMGSDSNGGNYNNMPSGGTMQNGGWNGGGDASNGSTNSSAWQPPTRCAEGQMPTADKPCIMNSGNGTPSHGSGPSDPMNACLAACPPPSDASGTDCRSKCGALYNSNGGNGNTCSQPQPNWPDCKQFICSGNTWSCDPNSMSNGSYDHSASCTQGCKSAESMKATDSACKGQNPPPWCTQSFETCQSQCASMSGGNGQGYSSSSGYRSSTNSMTCDYYPTGLMPTTCPPSIPTCMTLPSEQPQHVSCDDSKCTNAWHAARGSRSCWNQGDYDGKTQNTVQPWQGNGSSSSTSDDMNRNMSWEDFYMKMRAKPEFASKTKDEMYSMFQQYQKTNGQRINGINGANGVNGMNGINGVNGVNGMNGINGANVVNGMNGINGVNGVNGMNGINGVNGMNGINGMNSMNGMEGGPGYYQGGFVPGMMMQGQGSQNDDQMKKMYEDQQKRMSEETTRRSGEECARLAQPLTDSRGSVSADMKTKVQALVDECKTAAASIDPSNSDGFYKKMNDLHQRLGQVFQNVASCDGVQSYIHGMEQGATTEAPRFIEQTNKTNPTVAKQMEEMRQKTLAAVATAKSQANAGDCTSAQKTMDDIQSQFNKAMQTWSSQVSFPDSFVDKGAMADDFASKLQKKGVDFSANDIANKGLNDPKSLSIMSQLSTLGGKDFTNSLVSSGENTANLIKTLGANNASSDTTAYMAQLIAENSRLKQQIADLTDSLNAVQSQLVLKLSSLTPTPETALKIKTFMENDLQNSPLTPEKADELYKAFLTENGKQLVKQGVVTNTDVDPSRWYADDVTNANRAGIMKGNPDGTFAPEKSMNQAEAVRTLANALGVVVEKGGVPSDAKFSDYPNWGKDAAAALEKEGIDLSALTSEPDAAVTKAELAQVLAGIVPDSAVVGKEGKAFTDLSKVSADERAAIEKLGAAGIINGENGSAKFKPEDSVNRAVAAKLFTEAIDVTRAALTAK